MTIKQIFDEIAAEPGTNAKMEILAKYKDNELLKRVLYLANSKRVKYYIKQIPEYPKSNNITSILDTAIDKLSEISSRKLTGHDAIGFLSEILSSVSDDDSYIIERIIEKDCRIGMGQTNINKVFPKLIEDTPYQGAVSFDKKKAMKIFEKGKSGFSQEKKDGRYSNCIISDGNVDLESRSGEPTIIFGAEFLKELEKFEDCVLNGELTMDSKTSRYEANGIIASVIDIKKKTSERTIEETNKKIKEFEKEHGNFEDALSNIRFTVWDCITLEEYSNAFSNTPYKERLKNAEMIILNSGSKMVSVIETRKVKTFQEAMEHFQEMLSKGMEGTILKDPNSPWKDGKPSHAVKMKLEMDIDLKITGFNYGGKGTKNELLISSFNAESSDGLLKTKPQGLKEDMMKYVTENQDKLLWTIIQCKSCGTSQDSDGNYSLLHPVFICLRDDKNTCDSLESIKEIENMAKNLKS